MELFLFWLALSVIVGVAASNRARSGFLWWLLALVISPILAGLLLLAVGRGKSSATGEAAATPDTHVRCPDCRELVRRDARRCKHCGVGLTPQ